MRHVPLIQPQVANVAKYSKATDEERMKLAEVVLPVLLEEYKTLRQECLESVKHRTQIVSFGLAGAAALVGGTLSMNPHASGELLIAVFCVGVPLLMLLSLYMWFGELQRMMRAGNFLARQLEAQINAYLPEGSIGLTWENGQLRGRSSQMLLNYILVIFTFVGVMAASPWFAARVLSVPWASVRYFVVAVDIISAVALLQVGLSCFMLKRTGRTG